MLLFFLIFSVIELFAVFPFWVTGQDYISQDRLYRATISIDQLVNALFPSMLSVLFLTMYSDRLFGNPDETISSVLGKNIDDGTANWLGHKLCQLLALFDVNHCKRAIEHDE